MQNLGFFYELYMFSILKNCLISFSKHTLFFWHGSLMTQNVKAILLITQKSDLPSFLKLSIKTDLFTFRPTIKKKTKSEGQLQRC